jgi:hypothetical protein
LPRKSASVRRWPLKSVSSKSRPNDELVTSDAMNFGALGEHAAKSASITQQSARAAYRNTARVVRSMFIGRGTG